MTLQQGSLNHILRHVRKVAVMLHELTLGGEYVNFVKAINRADEQQAHLLKELEVYYRFYGGQEHSFACGQVHPVVGPFVAQEELEPFDLGYGEFGEVNHV